MRIYQDIEGETQVTKDGDKIALIRNEIEIPYHNGECEPCQECGEETWNIEYGQCSECGHTD